MRTLNHSHLLFLFTFICVANYSCKRGDTSPIEKSNITVSNTQGAVNANAIRNNIDNIIFNIVLGYDDAQDNSKTGTADYKKTIDPSPYDYPQTITIEYNKSTAQKGAIKKGKIIIFYNRPMYEPGSMASAYFDNFFINDTLVKGSMFTTNITNPDDSCSVYEHSGTQSLIYANRAFRKYYIDRIFTQIDGNKTFAKDDDRFQISGSIKVYDEKKPAGQIAETNLSERTHWTIVNPNENIVAVKENYADNKSYLNNADSGYTSEKKNSILVDESDGNRLSKKQHIKLQSSHR